jgi:osmotically-inducible protein OsmY
MSASADAGVVDRNLRDQRLAVDLAGLVRARCGRALLSFAASFRHGTVTLHGQVRGYYQKQVMLTTVLAMPSVKEVIDHIEVLPLEPAIRRHGCSELEEQSAA